MNWINASERLPPIESRQQSVNVTARLDTDVIMEGYVSHKSGEWYDHNSVRIHGKVTAWQPL